MAMGRGRLGMGTGRWEGGNGEGGNGEGGEGKGGEGARRGRISQIIFCPSSHFQAI